MSPQTSTLPFTGTNTLTAYDSYGNVATNVTAQNIPVTLTVSGPSTATLVLVNSGNDRQLEPANFVNGVANLTALGLKYTGLAGSVTLAATGQGGSPTTTAAVQINPGPLAYFSLAPTGPITATAGQVYTVTLTARDTSGNLVTGFTAGLNDVVFIGANGFNANTPTANGTAFGSPTAVNFFGGVGTVALMLYEAGVTAPIQATSGSIASTVANVPVVPGTPDELVLAATGSLTTTAGQPYVVTLTVLDGPGNVVTTLSPSQNISFTGASTTTGASGTYTPTVNGTPFGITTSANFVSGVATPTLVLNKAEQAPLRAFAGSLASNVLTVTVVPTTTAGSFAFSLTSPQTSTVPLTGTNTLTVYDPYGNVATGFDASVNVVDLYSILLSGTIAGLGINDNFQLNQTSDFAAGVADLTAQGMVFTRGDGGVLPEDTVFRAELNLNNAIFGLSATTTINP
jgi:hypothetical protein